MIWDVECSTLPWQGKFATVVIDPPWPTKGMDWKVGTINYYGEELMTLLDIAAMPIPQILADDAVVFLWVTMPHFRDAFRLLYGWGAEYRFMMTWVKSRGTKPVGYPTYNAEFIAVGFKGKPKFLDTKAFKVANEWPRREHSAKPEEFYELLRRVSPAPRIDVFNRRYIEGFWGWGKESPYPLLGPDGYAINKEAEHGQGATGQDDPTNEHQEIESVGEV